MSAAEDFDTGHSPGPIDDVDRRIVLATQAGMPVCARPFKAVGDVLGLDETEVMGRFRAMQARGNVRRIAAVPNHYKLGYGANGMTVWDVDDDLITEIGRRVGALPFVSHAYRRPRHPPVWPYNLFAMAHGRSHEEVREKVARIAEMIGPAARRYDVLFSTRILKKTGLRLAG